MRFLLFSLCLLLLGENAFASSLTCDAGSGSQSANLNEGQGEVQTNNFDASLGTASIFYAVQNPTTHHRAAFAGAGYTFSPDGALLEINSSHVYCHLAPDKLSFTPPPGPTPLDYLACAIDSANFSSDSATDLLRRMVKITSPINSTFPLEVRGEDEVVAFHVHYLSYDPAHGLEVTLTDKASGETAHFRGSAHALQKSFMLGLTIGDRAVSARFLRLGCFWTDDPKALDVVKQ
jgi:hypothetical protein